MSGLVGWWTLVYCRPHFTTGQGQCATRAAWPLNW